MKRFHLMIMSVAWVFCAGAQTMSLRECLEKGLENNYRIRMARVDENAAAVNDSRGNAGGLPSVDISAGYSGSMYSRDVSERETGAVTSSRDITDHTLSASVGASWMVFNGFKIQATKERLHELHAQGELKTRIAIEDFVADMVSEYYNYVRQSIRMDNLNYAVELSRERLRIVQERYSIGDNSKLDLKQAQVYFNADSAQSLKQNEALATARIRINALMASDDLSRYFTVADTAIVLLDGLDYTSLETDMMADNTDVLSAESARNIARQDLRAANARNYPYLKLNAGYGYAHNIYGSGASASRNNWGPDFGATVGINLLDGRHRVERMNARLDIQSAELEAGQTEQSLHADLADLWQAYNNNLRLLDLERQNLVTARETYGIAYERYLIGDLSGLELREAQKSLFDAEESLLQARYDTKLCEISLMQISGRVMEYLSD